jgi:hypothetical protein
MCRKIAAVKRKSYVLCTMQCILCNDPQVQTGRSDGKAEMVTEYLVFYKAPRSVAGFVAQRPFPV